MRGGTGKGAPAPVNRSCHELNSTSPCALQCVRHAAGASDRRAASSVLQIRGSGETRAELELVTCATLIRAQLPPPPPLTLMFTTGSLANLRPTMLRQDDKPKTKHLIAVLAQAMAGH